MTSRSMLSRFAEASWPRSDSVSFGVEPRVCAQYRAIAATGVRASRGKTASPNSALAKSLDSPGDGNLHRLEGVRIGMVAEDVGVTQQIAADLHPVLAAPYGSCPIGDGKGHLSHLFDRGVRFVRQRVDIAHGFGQRQHRGGEAACCGHTEDLDGERARPDRIEHARIPCRVKTRPRGPVSRNAWAAASDHTSSMIKRTRRSASVSRSILSISTAVRGAGEPGARRARRSSSAARTSPRSPTVTQKIPSGKRRRTVSSRASAAASTDLPMPPWPWSPNVYTHPVTPTAPDSVSTTALISSVNSSRAT